jgi:hypothetical protein
MKGRFRKTIRKIAVSETDRLKWTEISNWKTQSEKYMNKAVRKEVNKDRNEPVVKYTDD